MNSSYLPLLVGLLYLAIHIASIVAKEAAKRKERERKMQEVERRRMSEARLEMPPPGVEREELKAGAWESPSPVLAPAPQSSRPTNRLEDLATRRKQQLEQFRTRQVTQPPAPPRSTTRLPERAAPSTPLRLEPIPQQRKADADRDRLRRESKVNAEQQAQVKRAALVKSQRMQQVQREADRLRRHESATSEVVTEAPRPKLIPLGAHRAPPAILARLKDRNALREMFVLKELIDPPLALRQPIP